ncbi:MAG TPA: transketolase [Spirochaetia bacterium]|nr:MAG: transketolase [Spirochaetes bacterium GWB1_36_13]HCL57905.1 transketolase [Spirochaetia bacterium]
MKKYLALREIYGQKLVELGKNDENIFVMDADLSGSTRTVLFKNQFPDRHFNMGIAECNMLLFAAGAAISGKTVFASSFAMFETGRAWEIIRNTIAHDNLNVKIVSTHAGISVGEDGYSHQANEDIALMRAIPNMQVLCPADALETGAMIEYAAETKGPMYIRLSRETFPVLFQEESYSFTPNQAKVLKDGKDVTLIACGRMVDFALEASHKLEDEKISVRVLNASSIKPMDSEAIIESARKTKLIITCEEHSIIGGLGSAVIELLSDSYPVKVIRMGLKDVFGQSGKPQELFKFYELSTEDIIKTVKENLQ